MLYKTTTPLSRGHKTIAEGVEAEEAVFAEFLGQRLLAVAIKQGWIVPLEASHDVGATG